MKTGLVAFSGGLDTSFLVPFSREQYGLDRVVTCTVDTGGMYDAELERVAARSKEVGADEHVVVKAEREYYDRVLKYLIYGNVSRDGYPLCTGAERLIQAEAAIRVCRERGIGAFLHGCTGAGNDQYRFELVSEVLGGGIETFAPIREFNVSRDRSTSFLLERGVTVPRKTTDYSVNVGLWGISIGGKETHSSTGLLPDSAWVSQPEEGLGPRTIALEFRNGEPSRLESPWGGAEDPVAIIKLLAAIGNRYAIGRHYHVGTSIPGKKGRLAYESPAADILYEAHRTLEKITLTGLQIAGKKPIAEEFGRLIHEAKFYDPYLGDLAAFLESTQRRVTGRCEVTLAPGYIKSAAAESLYNLLAAKGATYGEVSDAYTGAEAKGACKLNAFEQRLYRAAGPA